MLTPNFETFPVLATERLILRNHEQTDLQASFELRTNEDVMRYIDRPRPANIQDCENQFSFIKECFATNQMLVWVIALKENPEKMIGTIGYYRTIYANHRAEIGYMLHPSYWRMGIIDEALRHTIAFGFETLNLHSIEANINPGNDASRQMLLKHNFVKEAYFKENYYFNGKFLDSEIYSLLKNTKMG